MPRFFFSMEDVHSFQDHDGTELPNVAAARAEAVKVLGEVFRDKTDFWETESFRLIVRDHAGLTLFTLEVFANLAPVMRHRADIA